MRFTTASNGFKINRSIYRPYGEDTITDNIATQRKGYIPSRLLPRKNRAIACRAVGERFDPETGVR